MKNQLWLFLQALEQELIMSEASFSFAYGFEVLEIYVNSYIFSYRRAIILKTYRTDRH